MNNVLNTPLSGIRCTVWYPSPSLALTLRETLGSLTSDCYFCRLFLVNLPEEYVSSSFVSSVLLSPDSFFLFFDSVGFRFTYLILGLPFSFVPRFGLSTNLSPFEVASLPTIKTLLASLARTFKIWWMFPSARLTLYLTLLSSICFSERQTIHFFLNHLLLCSYP